MFSCSVGFMKFSNFLVLFNGLGLNLAFKLHGDSQVWSTICGFHMIFLNLFCISYFYLYVQNFSCLYILVLLLWESLAVVFGSYIGTFMSNSSIFGLYRPGVVLICFHVVFIFYLKWSFYIKESAMNFFFFEWRLIWNFFNKTKISIV